jgi:hypothetical protein
MPDDVTVGLNTVAADELLTVNDVPQVEPFPKAERVKPGWGADGVFNDVTPAAPLPVSDGAEGDAPPVLPTNARGVRGYLRAIYDHLTGETAVDLSPLGATADAATADTVIGRLKAIANALATTASNFLAVRLTDGSSYLNSTAGRLQVADGGVALNVDPSDRAGRLLGHVTVDALPEVEVKNDAGTPLATTPSKAGDVVGALTDGRKTVTTPGTAVALRGSLACKWVCVTALTSNSGQVNVGGSGVLAVLGTSTGSPLAAGQSITIPIDDAAKVFGDARVAGEGVSFTVGA